MSGRGTELLHTRADWIRILESIYAPSSDDETWGRSILEALLPIFRRVDGVKLGVVEHEPEWRSLAVRLNVVIGDESMPFDGTPADFKEPGREIFDAFFYPPALAITHSEIGRRLSERGRLFLGHLRSEFERPDALGMITHPEPGLVAVCATMLPRATALTKHQRRVLSQLALHIGTGYRLRRRPEVVRAVLSPDGKLLHREDGAPETRAMVERVKRIDASRTRAARREPTAIDVWEALVTGQSSIIERYDGSQRRYIVVDNAPSHRTHHALSRREVEILRMAARGLPVKLIAYGLGLSSPAVSNALGSAAMKLGLAARLDLVRVASLLTDTPNRSVDPTKLTKTEREIFELVRCGLSNEEIARARRRSVRTVANQVGSVLQKTGSPSRRALVTAKRRTT